MTRFVVGGDRSQSALFPERLDDYLGEDDPVRAVDVFVDELDLAGLGFVGVEPEATGRCVSKTARLLAPGAFQLLNVGFWLSATFLLARLEEVDTDFFAVDPSQFAAAIGEPRRGKQQEKFL